MPSGIYIRTEKYKKKMQEIMKKSSKKNSKKRVAVNTVEWFFKDYNHTSILSYHMIETGTIPDKYDVDYSEYYII